MGPCEGQKCVAYYDAKIFREVGAVLIVTIVSTALDDDLLTGIGPWSNFMWIELSLGKSKTIQKKKRFYKHYWRIECVCRCKEINTLVLSMIETT